MDENINPHSSHKSPSKLNPQAKYGVIGVCGVVGNLTARLLSDRDFNVIGTDSKSEEECKFNYTLKNYDLPLYLEGHPEIFFSSSDYIIPPPSLSEDSKLFKKIKSSGSQILEVDDILKKIKPDKPVICITGTNGKTTSTSLLKQVCNYGGMKTAEHGFKELQGNIDYIPPLQCRLKGDVAVLETGTFGNSGDLELLMKRCQPSCGIITNITPDHLHHNQDFLDYARIKGEFVEYLKNKQLIVNADDPTVWGLVEPYSSDNEDIITFGVDHKSEVKNSKSCWCGQKISINETISGMGYYHCSCGMERPPIHYLATEIHPGSFTLQTPQDRVKINTPLMGLHNIYNTLGVIAAAREFLNIPLNVIVGGVESFKGVPGRLDYLGKWKGKEVIIDYAHNPGGVETVLRELKKTYEKIAVVITVSSESGPKGDIEILNKSLKIADCIIPASFYSRKAADNFLNDDKIVLTSEYPEKFKNGTLGANLDQVLEGLKKALRCDVSAVICIGEASFKYRADISRKILLK
jgi:UDP-N-acetylmuramate--alanine ligase